MTQVAKLFTNGRSQAVRLPAAYRFDAKEVFIYRNPETGDVILSRRPINWDSFLKATENLEVDDDFLSQKERRQFLQGRDPFEDWVE